MKKCILMSMIFCILSLGFVGCPMEPPMETEIMVSAVLQDEADYVLFNDDISNFNQIMIASDAGPVHGTLMYTGEQLSNLKVNFTVDGDLISVDVFSTAKTFEDSDLLGYLIAIGIMNSANDFMFESGMEDSVPFNSLDFYLGEVVDSMTVVATSANGAAFITTFTREGSAIQDNFVLVTESYPLEGGMVTGAGTYPAGKTVTIEATPADGYSFDHWIVNGTDAYNNPGLITMDSDVIVTAVFTQNTVTNYNLSITVEGQGTTTGAGSYAMGTEVTITATPASGWTFDHWVVNGTDAHNNPGTVMMNGDVMVVAVFTQNTVTNYNLSITVEGQGTTTGAGSYAMGTEVTITATPASGWVFDHWMISNTTVYESETVVTVNGNMSIVAVFSTDANPGGLIKVDLTWNGSTLILDAKNANPGSIGLELYHQSGGAPWIERQVFGVDNGNAHDTVTEFRPNILRFGVVSNDNVSIDGYIPIETLTVKINGQNVPIVDSAFQVDVSTLNSK